MRGLPAASYAEPMTTTTLAGPPWWRRPVAWVEGVVAVGLFAASLVEIADTRYWKGPSAAAVVGAAFITLPLAVASRWPRLVVGVVLGSTCLWSAFAQTPQSSGVFFALLVASFVAGLRIDQRHVLFLVAAGVTSLVAGLRTQADSSPGDYAFTFGLMAGVYGFGLLAQRRGRVAADALDRADRAEQQQELMTQIALQDERARIARELHDVIAHAVSVIVVQSVGGRTVLRQDPDQAAGAFDTIEATGQLALREMRRLLGVLRTVDDLLSLSPQPSLDQLPELIGRAKDTGLRATLTVTGTPSASAAGVGLSAYRIVQEALTNALKHSAPCDVDVALDYQADALCVKVTNSAPDGVRVQPADNGEGHAGHGLIGMRERALLYGGDFAAGPTPHGGFAVAARLPLGRS